MPFGLAATIPFIIGPGVVVVMDIFVDMVELVKLELVIVVEFMADIIVDEPIGDIVVDFDEEVGLVVVLCPLTWTLIDKENNRITN